MKTSSLALIFVMLAGCSSAPPRQEQVPPAPGSAAAPPASAAPAKIALALGGGAVRGFAHIGVIKVLEAQGIHPDIVAGTSAGSLVGALYAGGYSGFELQRIALNTDDSVVSDWALPDRGVIKGEALQNFVNSALGQRTIDKLPKTLAVVATDLQSGEAVVFRTGNTGMAVRASSSVPGLFQPVRIGGREYVDGGLVSPVPVRIARALGAEVVIAVDIAAKPQQGRIFSTLDVLLQTFTIMGNSIAGQELSRADVVIRPNVAGISGSDFQAKHLAILEGEKAAAAAMPALRARLAALESRREATR